MALLPNLSSLRCCPAPTGVILTTPVSPEICYICHEPVFGCTKRKAIEGGVARPVAPGSAEDDWQGCAPEQWRMRPEGEDGASSAVAVMRRCGGMIHVGCLLRWVDSLSHAAQQPLRCPKCSGTECISPELLEDLERHRPQPLEQRLRQMDRNGNWILTHIVQAGTRREAMEEAREAYKNWNLRYFSRRGDPAIDPEDKLRGKYRLEFEEKRRRNAQDQGRTFRQMGEIMNQFDQQHHRLDQYWADRSAFNAYFPYEQEQQPLDDPAVMERLSVFVKIWEPMMERLLAEAQDANRRLWELQQIVPLDLEVVRTLHDELLARQQKDKRDQDELYELFKNTHTL